MKKRNETERQNIMREAKENDELVQFVKSLTKEEIQRIKEQREFETIKPNTPTWKVAVICDSLRQQMRNDMLKIKKRLWNIDDMTNNISRLKSQLVSGTITEDLKPGIKMNEAELKSTIQHHEWLRDGEANAIPLTLADVRAIVGHKDVSGKIIMSQETFDKLVSEIEAKLQAKGYDMFGELK